MPRRATVLRSVVGTWNTVSTLILASWRVGPPVAGEPQGPSERRDRGRRLSPAGVEDSRNCELAKDSRVSPIQKIGVSRKGQADQMGLEEIDVRRVARRGSTKSTSRGALRQKEQQQGPFGLLTSSPA